MKIKIKNFKCFQEQTISLGQITVLAGANSVGKSSIVQSLLLIRTAIEGLNSNPQWKQLHWEPTTQLNPLNLSLNGPFLLNLGASKEVLNRSASEERISFRMLNDEEKMLEFVLQLPEDEDTYNLILQEINFSHKDINLVTSSLPIFAKNFYYLNAERIGPRLRHEVDDLPFLHTGWQGEYAIQLIGGNKHLPIEETRCFDAQQIKTLLQQSRLWLDNIAPGVAIDDANLIKGIKTAEVNFGRNQSKPTNIGFGVSYVLPIVVNGLVAQPNTMFIVENPEAHLHPQGQSQIGKFLAQVAASGVSVVLETHSEHVINGIRIASLNGTIDTKQVVINFFHREGEEGKVGVKQIGINESGDLTAYPKGFFDQEQRDMAEIIRQKRKKMEIKP